MTTPSFTINKRQTFFRVLYEKLITLEQECRSQDLILHNEITALRNSQGVLIWRLQNFNKTLQDMRNQTKQLIYSPAFYSTANGYKFCARLNIFRENANWMSLVLHTMESENDDTLNWPFHGLVSFLLVHPEDPSRNVHETAMSLPDLVTFKRPNSRSQTGFGFMEFVEIEKLQDYLKNDQLTIRVEVKALE